MSVRPWQVCAFLLSVLLLCWGLGALWPAEGVRLWNGKSLHFPDPLARLLVRDSVAVDISAIVALPTEDPADIPLTDTLAEDTVTIAPFVFDSTRIAPLEERIALHYPNGDRSVLYPVFAALEQARGGKKPMRIMHYGDSQLEGDRITNYVRNKLQHQFGGSGPGLVTVADIVPHFSIGRSLSANWRRYSVMGTKAADHYHDRYGALNAFARFTPILPVGAEPDTVPQHATITLDRAKNAYAKAQAWTECRLYFGWHRAPVLVEVTADGVEVASELVQPGDRLMVREWRFPSTPASLRIDLFGHDSPDVFGISLEGHAGVNMDNIGVRGAAGYEFRRQDQALLGAMTADLDVRLLILQFGGNVVPGIKDSSDVEGYGRMFAGQIARFRKMMPKAAILVIGPGDMSIRDGEHMVTRPYLEAVNNTLKRTALDNGAVFWDMFAAMGGRNSMVSWVEATPALAATDYVHFSPQGSRKVGELFYTAFINDFARYHKARP